MTVGRRNLTLICLIGQAGVRDDQAHKQQVERNENSFEEETNRRKTDDDIFI